MMVRVEVTLLSIRLWMCDESVLWSRTQLTFNALSTLGDL